MGPSVSFDKHRHYLAEYVDTKGSYCGCGWPAAAIAAAAAAAAVSPPFIFFSYDTFLISKSCLLVSRSDLHVKRDFRDTGSSMMAIECNLQLDRVAVPWSLRLRHAAQRSVPCVDEIGRSCWCASHASSRCRTGPDEFERTEIQMVNGMAETLSDAATCTGWPYDDEE